MGNTDCLGRENLPEIPSEYLEPYLVQYMSYEIECVATGHRKPEEARQNLRAIDLFVSRFGGIHAKYATMNSYDKLIRLSDEDMVRICKEVLNSSF